MEKSYQANINFLNVEVATQISNKVDLKEKKITRDKGDITLMRKDQSTGSLTVLILQNRPSICMRQKLIKLNRETDKSTIIFRDFNTLISVTDGATK